jgi:hypothetical protein
MKFWKIDRVISIATLVASVTALFLVLKRPHPVAPPAQPPAAVAANAQSFQNKIEQLEQSSAQGQSSEVRLNAQEVSAAIAQASGAISDQATSPSQSGGPPSSGGDPLSGDLGPGQPNVKDYQVNFEGDQVVGQFLTQVAGKDVWVTVKGHLGSKDGYATFDPTEFKVGDLNVPVSLVNDQLQKRLMEQRDRLKLPDSVNGIKVENSEVVLSNK